MDRSLSQTGKRTELADVATAMIDGRLHLIEGVRRLCSLRHGIDNPDSHGFMPIRAIDSETEHFPLGELRHQCSAEYLKRLDAEMAEYLSDARQDILAATREIILLCS